MSWLLTNTDAAPTSSPTAPIATQFIFTSFLFELILHQNEKGLQLAVSGAVHLIAKKVANPCKAGEYLFSYRIGLNGLQFGMKPAVERCRNFDNSFPV